MMKNKNIIAILNYFKVTAAIIINDELCDEVANVQFYFKNLMKY